MSHSSSKNEITTMADLARALLPLSAWPYVVALVMAGYVIILLARVASDVSATSELLRSM